MNARAVRNQATRWLASLDGQGPRAANLRVLGSAPGWLIGKDLLTEVAAVPTPGSLSLLSAGLLVLGLRRRRLQDQ